MDLSDIEPEAGGQTGGPEQDEEDIAREIGRLKKQLNAVILVHNYQRSGVQDVGDFLGDSLGLARQAASTDADVIVFCGVYFMAETAYMLSPEKKVILPDLNAGCPLADMAEACDVAEMKKKYPGAEVVCYVNSSAEVKAVSDYCCTSSNAVEVVKAVGSDQVIFIPDKNLGSYVAERVDKEVITWNGFCVTHECIGVEDIEARLKEHPRAEVIAHPECRPEVQAVSQHICSTSKMSEAARNSEAVEFIVATESGMLYPLRKAVPGKSFYAPVKDPLCPNMKLITLPKVLKALRGMGPEVTVPEDIRVRALGAVERMLSLG
ncbi:MAG: quinolinate synthase NadA [Actinobacteria bacterium]|nr:quinolinate synthase NadA [Actinomycetota bacterium]